MNIEKNVEICYVKFYSINYIINKVRQSYILPNENDMFPTIPEDK